MSNAEPSKPLASPVRTRLLVLAAGLALVALIGPGFVTLSMGRLAVQLASNCVLGCATSTTATVVDARSESGTSTGSGLDHGTEAMTRSQSFVTLRVAGQNRAQSFVDVPESAYHAVYGRQEVSVLVWHGWVTEVEGRGINPGWNTSQGILYLILGFPVLLVGVVISAAQTTRLASARRRERTGATLFAAVAAATTGFVVAMTAGLVAGFTRTGLYWWPPAGVAVVVAVAALVFVRRSRSHAREVAAVPHPLPMATNLGPSD